MTDIPEIVEPQEPTTPQEPELIRVVVVDRCGPSPRRAMYGPGFTYNVVPDEAEWLFENQFAYREGDEPLLPCEERKRLEATLEMEREAAARVEHAKKLIAERAARKKAKERAADLATMRRHQQELAAIATKKAEEAKQAAEEAARLAAKLAEETE